MCPELSAQHGFHWNSPRTWGTAHFLWLADAGETGCLWLADAGETRCLWLADAGETRCLWLADAGETGCLWLAIAGDERIARRLAMACQRLTDSSSGAIARAG